MTVTSRSRVVFVKQTEFFRQLNRLRDYRQLQRSLPEEATLSCCGCR